MKVFKTVAGVMPRACMLKKLIFWALTRSPAGNLTAVRSELRAERAPYRQGTTYRYGNVVMDDWKGKVDTCPINDGPIDYDAATYGAVWGQALDREILEQYAVGEFRNNTYNTL